MFHVCFITKSEFLGWINNRKRRFKFHSIQLDTFRFNRKMIILLTPTQDLIRGKLGGKM